MSSANMTATTRELWLRSVTRNVFLAMPMLAAFLLARRVKVMGGTAIKKTLDYAEMDDLAQDYANANTPLTAGKKDYLATAQWSWKRFQVPIEYDEDEESENSGGSDTQIVDLVADKVKKGHRAARIKMYKLMYQLPSATSDSDGHFQGLTDALDHDKAYGGLARTIGSTLRTWWQGASYDGTYADRNTARTASIATFRTMLPACMRYLGEEKASQFLNVSGTSIFNKFRGQVEATGDTGKYSDTKLGKYGFRTIEVDGVEFVADSWLDTDPWGSSSGEQTSKWDFLLHVPDWELRLFPGRDLTRMTAFEYQGKQAGGFDKYLARIFVKGNMVCYQPNASMWLSQMS